MLVTDPKPLVSKSAEADIDTIVRCLPRVVAYAESERRQPSSTGRDIGLKTLALWAEEAANVYGLPTDETVKDKLVSEAKAHLYLSEGYPGCTETIIEFYVPAGADIPSQHQAKVWACWNGQDFDADCDWLLLRVSGEDRDGRWVLKCRYSLEVG